MEQQQPTSSRKKFVVWGLGIIGTLVAWKLKPRKISREKTTTVKMLSTDGKLVEVDASKVSEASFSYCGKRKKISDDQLKNWVSKK